MSGIVLLISIIKSLKGSMVTNGGDDDVIECNIITCSVKKQAIGARQVHMPYQLFNLCVAWRGTRMLEALLTLTPLGLKAPGQPDPRDTRGRT